MDNRVRNNLRYEYDRIIHHSELVLQRAFQRVADNRLTFWVALGAEIAIIYMIWV